MEEYPVVEKLRQTATALLSKTKMLSKTAKHGETYSFASTQVNLPDDMAKEVMAWGKEHILDEELTKAGREDEIHVTVLYGLKGDNPGQVNRILRHFRPFKIRLGLITHFGAPDFDVLKIAIDSPVLENMHYFFEKELDNGNTFPTFFPHVTIAYLKKGMAKRYIGNDFFSGKVFTAEDLVFSSKDGNKIVLKIK